MDCASILIPRRRHLSAEEAPDIIITLLSVALDATTSSMVQNEVTKVINSMLACIVDSDAGCMLESKIATQVFAFMDGLQTINKVYLLTFFNRGCPQNCRIARWLARACLLQLEGSPLVRHSQYDSSQTSSSVASRVHIAPSLPSVPSYRSSPQP